MFTSWCGLALFPVAYDIVPCDVCSYSVQGWNLGLLGCVQESVVFEADYIPLLWLEPLHELSRACRGSESHAIWSMYRVSSRWVRDCQRTIHIPSRVGQQGL